MQTLPVRPEQQRVRLPRIVFFCLSCLCLAAPAVAASDKQILIGWWTDPYNAAAWPGYAENGANFLHLNGATDYKISQLMKALDVAHGLGMKVSVSLTRTEHTSWPWDASQINGFVNAIKGHPAIWGWYLADEPELSAAPATTQQRLLVNPGYYPLVKAADPERPAWLVFSGSPRPGWIDTADAFGVDLYPGTSGQEFGDRGLRRAYDAWNAGLSYFPDSRSLFVAVVQGFGAGRGPWRDLSVSELRYLVFSAVVQGVSKVLFWYDGWANRWTLDTAGQVFRFVRDMRAELANGAPNDPAITVSEPADRLAYLYGASGNRHVILAVNIANRMVTEGSPLTNVRFGIPAGVNPEYVEVLGENRRLPVAGNAFTDNFARFEVHAYAFSHTSVRPPPRTAPPPRRVKRASEPAGTTPQPRQYAAAGRRAEELRGAGGRKR